MPMRKYEPNDRDREIVLRMAAIPSVTRETIAFCITNDRTGRAINRRTLEKHYAKELEVARGVMQNITMKSFVEQIVDHSWPATRLALSNYCGLKDGEMIANVANVDNSINVRFIPSPHVNEPAGLRPGVDGYDIDLAAAPPAEPKLLPTWARQDAQLREAITAVAPTNNGPTEPTYRRHEVTPDFAARPLPEPLPVKGPYRTEMDDPASANTPWYKKPLTGRLAMRRGGNNSK